MRNYIASLFTLTLLVACGQNSEPVRSPSVYVFSSPRDPGIGEEVEFGASVTAHGQPYTINWDFGDGATIVDGSDTVTHTYRAVGEYTAQATVTTGSRTASADRLITVGATPSLRSWIYIERTDPITDANTSYISTSGSSLTLYVRCSTSAIGVDVYITQNRHLGIQNSYAVTYRVDERDPVTARWDASASYQAAFARASHVPDLFRELAAGSEAIFRISAFDGDRTYRRVRLEGFQVALDKLGCYTGQTTLGKLQPGTT